MESEMRDLMEAHREELFDAMEAQNTALAAAQAAYAAAIDKSRQKLTTGIEARLSVWNGEPAKVLPDCGGVSVRGDGKEGTYREVNESGI
jgi:hypothetical protein